MSDDTLFDKILRKEIPAEIVYEDDYVLAFKDINPQAPVHVLVLPKTRFRNVTELKDGDAETVGRFMMGVSHVAAELGLGERGYRVVFNTGPDALQTVEYIHAHILGGRSMEWPPG